MRILFLTDNFPPESNAPATRTFEHAVAWVREGNQVTIITGAPNFPEGELYTGYRNRWYAVEWMSGVRVVRVKTYIAANVGFLRRTLDYLSFMVSAFVAGLFQQRPDVIVGTSPQFFTVCSAWVLSVCRRRPFVFELRDLWPASIKAVGAMRDGIALRLLERIEMLLYRKADAVVCVTGSYKSDLVARGIEAGKVAVVANGVDLAAYAPRERDVELAARYGLDGRFVVGYVGTHGMAHALHRVLEAADLLRGRDDIVFLFVGSGARKEALVRQAKAMGLDNVRFAPRQARDVMPRVWSLCDVSLIHLGDDRVFATVIPSKVYESMAMGIPVILAAPTGEATTLIGDCRCGVTVPPENPRLLAETIAKVRDHPHLLAAFSAAGVASAADFARGRQANRMLDVLAAVVGGRGNSVGEAGVDGLMPRQGSN